MDGVNQKSFRRQIEVIVESTGNPQFNFSNDQTLQQNATIVKIIAYRANKVAKGKTGKVTVADNVFNVASLTLMKKNPSGEIAVDSMPLTELCRADNNGVVEPLNINAIDVTSCFIKVSETANLVANSVFILLVEYTRKGS